MVRIEPALRTFITPLRIKHWLDDETGSKQEAAHLQTSSSACPWWREAACGGRAPGPHPGGRPLTGSSSGKPPAPAAGRRATASGGGALGRLRPHALAPPPPSWPPRRRRPPASTARLRRPTANVSLLWAVDYIIIPFSELPSFSSLQVHRATDPRRVLGSDHLLFPGSLCQ